MSSAVLMAALAEYGTKEIPGKDHNPEILKYFTAAGLNPSDWSDETAWCSAFINYVANVANVEQSCKLNARSWLDVGQQIQEPQPGDIVILWRKSPQDWRGHVGIFIKAAGDIIYILGGNQNNQVNIKPYSKSRLLGYRRLRNL